MRPRTPLPGQGFQADDRQVKLPTVSAKIINLYLKLMFSLHRKERWPHLILKWFKKP